MNGDGTPRRSERTSGRERVDYRESSMECDTQSDNNEDDRSATLSYRLKLHVADPRYITSSEDGNRVDVICTVEQVKELIARKATAEDGIAAIWLTMAEMGFSLTEEQDEVVCAKDVKEGKITDRFLAPAISRFATDTWSMNRQTADVKRKLEDLHQRWGRTNKISNSENIKAQADNEAKVTKKFIRIIQWKDLPWERDSIARAANDPEHIPDCNIKAMVGQHFLFHEPIPRAINGQGYLRVTTKSLWWQHEQFPKVWTEEGLSTCIENGYQWTINSTTWNHLRVQWQGQPLDLLRCIHEEVHLQNTLEASGYRSPTWRILRALQSCSKAKVLVGESMITAAPFFEGAGRPSKPYWGPQQGRRVILWESLSPESQQRCLTELQNDEEWVVWCKANPKDKAAQTFREYGKCIFEGKRAKVTQANDNQEGSSGGKHVTRARGWWKRGDVDACAVQTNMQCWVSNNMIFDDEQVATQLSEAWEHDSSKDELNVVLQGLEQHFWRGTEAGWLGCYNFAEETWAGDGSVHNRSMGAGSVCLQRPGLSLTVRVGREEEGVSSLRAELAAIARTLQATPVASDLLYLCDSEAALNKISQWIGSGPRTTLAGDANADIMMTIIECLRERVLRGARTFMVKIKAHRGEPLNEKADTQAENARQLSPECQQWTTRTQRMTYEWEDSNGIRHVTAWSKAVRNAMLRGGAEYQKQRVLDRAGTN
jgi:ribonuclease HI